MGLLDIYRKVKVRATLGCAERRSLLLHLSPVQLTFCDQDSSSLHLWQKMTVQHWCCGFQSRVMQVCAFHPVVLGTAHDRVACTITLRRCCPSTVHWSGIILWFGVERILPQHLHQPPPSNVVFPAPRQLQLGARAPADFVVCFGCSASSVSLYPSPLVFPLLPSSS